MAGTKPFGPTYVPLDLTLQESRVDGASIKIPDVNRFRAAHRPGPSPSDVDAVVDLFKISQRTAFMIGRVGRSEASWNQRIELADAVNATVITDQKQSCAFPYPHRRQPVAPGTFLLPDAGEIISAADLIVVLDWVDLAGTFKIALPDGSAPQAKVVNCSQDSGLANGWSKDTGAFAPTDLFVQCDPDAFIEAIHARLVDSSPPPSQHPNGVASTEGEWPPVARPPPIYAELGTTSEIRQSQFAKVLYSALSPWPATMVRLNLGWNATDLRVSEPLSYLGGDGGAGIGSGPGMVVGAALALHDQALEGGQRRLPFAVLGDGDLLMGNSALWTAASNDIPLLIVIANNASFFNDEVHQERIANQRQRPSVNKWIGKDPHNFLALDQG
jgi:thiamine pyrophosphate-dependent acetolactate synthase large subunit-like protein